MWGDRYIVESTARIRKKGIFLCLINIENGQREIDKSFRELQFISMQE